MILGLAEVLTLQEKSEEAIELMERGLTLSINEKEKNTTHAALRFLYLKCGKTESPMLLFLNFHILVKAEK